MLETESWDIEINKDKSLFNFQFLKVWEYRDLLFLFVKRDIVSFYKQTIFGPIWFLLQPIFTTAIYSFVFSNLAGMPTNGLPGPLFYILGITTWTFFADSLIKVSTVFKDNTQILGKVYFPRIIMPLSIVISNGIKLLIQLCLVVGLLVYFSLKGTIGYYFEFKLLLFPIFVFFLFLQGLGFGMIVSSLTTKYRDLAFLVVFGVQLFMYATPVIYSLELLQNKSSQFMSLLYFNPLTYIFEGLRCSLFGKGVLTLTSFIASFLTSIIIFFVGLLLFNKVEKTFIDTI